MQACLRSHSAASIRSAMVEFLDLLDGHDVDATTGYYRHLPSRAYFATLRANQAGVWESAIRNITYGLDRFSPGLVVDMGCGHGMQAYVFAVHGRRVLGIDPDETRIEVGNRIAAARGLGMLEFRVGNARTHMSTLRAGAVWHHRSLHHIPERTDFERTALAYFRAVHGAASRRFPRVHDQQRDVPRPRARSTAGSAQRSQDARPARAGRIHDRRSPLPRLPVGPAGPVPTTQHPRIEEALSRAPLVRSLGGSFSVAAYTRPTATAAAEDAESSDRSSARSSTR